MVLVACAQQPAATTTEPAEPVVVEQTVVVETTVEVQVEVQSTVEVERIVEVTPTPGPRSITIGMNELVTSLDPPTDWAIAATWIHMNIFDCLVWRDRETAEFAPYLAESWENVDDQTWIFTLREGVTFHNGEPFNADAVKYTYDRIREDDTMITHGQWTFIEEIKVLGRLRGGNPSP